MGFDLTPLRICWLALTLAGFVAFWLGGFPRPSAPEMVGMATLALWCLIETMVRRNWSALLVLPVLLAGVGAALPLYLFLRSRRIA